MEGQAGGQAGLCFGGAELRLPGKDNSVQVLM